MKLKYPQTVVAYSGPRIEHLGGAKKKQEKTVKKGKQKVKSVPDEIKQAISTESGTGQK